MRVQIKFPATDSTLLRTFDETDSLAAVVDYAKEVSLSTKIRLGQFLINGFVFYP